MQNLWIGASAYIHNQERGMPKYGTIAEINGTQVKVRRHLSPAQLEDDLMDDYAVYDINELEARAPEVNDVPWDDGWEPIIVEEPHVVPTSLIVIEQLERYERHDAFMVLVNAEVTLTKESERIEIIHSFARDEEGDSSRIFRADLNLTRFEHSWGRMVEWHALMSQPHFFNPSSDSPWKHAEKQDDKQDHTVNYGYPYLPPRAAINKHPFPLPVKITLRYGTPEYLEKMLHRFAGLDDH